MKKKRGTKPKRYEYHITYDAANRNWVCKIGGAIFDRCHKRANLIRSIASLLRLWHDECGQHAELIIHRKDQTIGKGSSSRRTYGGDSPRTKG